MQQWSSHPCLASGVRLDERELTDLDTTSTACIPATGSGVAQGNAKTWCNSRRSLASPVHEESTPALVCKQALYSYCFRIFSRVPIPRDYHGRPDLPRGIDKSERHRPREDESDIATRMQIHEPKKTRMRVAVFLLLCIRLTASYAAVEYVARRGGVNPPREGQRICCRSYLILACWHITE